MAKASILKVIDTAVRRFEKPLVVVVGIFMDLFVILTVLHAIRFLNGKIFHENPVNLFCGLENGCNGSPILL